jgi:lipoate-protein ligase A
VRVVRSRSSAAEFHARAVPDPAIAEIWWHEVTAPALVLGSNQDRSIVDDVACRRAGVEVVRRRSGGGAVLLIPGEIGWFDVIVPAGAPGWADDVHAPMIWLGRRIAAALGELGVGALSVHEGPLVRTAWSSTVCFDGLGAGEVLRDGRKLVGMSQRRTRSSARLQCCWYTIAEPDAIVDLLAGGHRPPPGALHPVATIDRTVSDALAGVVARG